MLSLTMHCANALPNQQQNMLRLKGLSSDHLTLIDSRILPFGDRRKRLKDFRRHVALSITLFPELLCYILLRNVIIVAHNVCL